MLFGLIACVQNQEPAVGNNTEPAVGSNTKPAGDNTESENLYGSPWVTSMATGNLPQEAPEAKDDLYLYYNYDEIAAHQGQMYTPLTENMNVIRDYLSEFMKSGNLSGAADGSYTNAELEQLAIFYQQAADLETLGNTGLSELQPYLDRIQNAQSLSELNAILVSEDFPFSPYLYFLVCPFDLSSVNGVMVYPELLFVDNLDGAINYQDSDDDAVNKAIYQNLSSKLAKVVGDLNLLGLSQEEAISQINELLAFEKSYAKYIDSIEVLPDTYASGDRWKAEAGADLIGLELVMTVAEKTSGFDYEELFKNTTYLYLEVVPSADILYIYLLIDGHPLKNLRTNINVQMFDKLYETYGIAEGDGMYLPPEKRLHFYW